jgi:hypothetical protein
MSPFSQPVRKLKNSPVSPGHAETETVEVNLHSHVRAPMGFFVRCIFGIVVASFDGEEHIDVARRARGRRSLVVAACEAVAERSFRPTGLESGPGGTANLCC